MATPKLSDAEIASRRKLIVETLARSRKPTLAEIVRERERRKAASKPAA